MTDSYKNLNDDDEAKKRPGTSEGRDGFSYEIAILTLVLHRAKQKEINSFHMASNMDGVGAFDDLVFIDYSEPRWGLFLQAKHKGKSITQDALLEKTGDFSICKYFDSYQTIKKIKKFRDINVTCVLYSTGGVAYKNIEMKNNISQPSIPINRGYSLDDLISKFEIEGNKAKPEKFQLSNDVNSKYVNSLLQITVENLANKLIELASNKTGSLAGDLVDYQFLLAKEVIDVNTRKIKPSFFEKKVEFWSVFRETMRKKVAKELLANLEPIEKIAILKEITKTPTSESISKAIELFIKYIPKKKRLEIITGWQKWPEQFQKQVKEIESCLETLEVEKEIIDEAIKLACMNQLKSLEFKNFPASFGRIDSVSLHDNKQLEELAAQFRKAFRSDNSTEVRLSQLQIKLERLFGLVGSLLIFDSESKTFKFNYDSELWKPFSTNLNQAKSIRFVNDVAGLTLINANDRKLVNEFLDNMWFYVKQPKVNQLKDLLKLEISKNCCGVTNLRLSSEDDTIFRYVYNQTELWWTNPEGGWLSNEHQYFEEAILTVLDGLFNEKHQKFKALEFRSDVVDGFKFVDLTGGAVNIVTDHPLITSSKLSHYYGKKQVHYLIDWEIVKSPECAENLKKVIKSYGLNPGNKSPIIIVVSNNKVDFSLDCSSFKNCILISPNKIISYIFTDTCNGMTDLTRDSQEQILAKETITFQGVPIRLNDLITTEKLREAIDATTLSKLLFEHKIIKIGKTPGSFTAEGVEDYYVQRILQRHGTFLMETLRDGSEFFITESSNFEEKHSTPDSDVVIISDSDEAFKTLCSKFNKRNIHWVKKTSGKLQWQKSCGSLRKLRNIVSNFIQDFEVNYFKPPSVELLVAEPGMGKSTIFSFIANETKQKNPTFWVSNVCLHDHSGVFSKWLQTRNTENQSAQEFLFDALKKKRKENNLDGPAILEREIFYHLYETKQIIIFLDGYDEISPNYEKQVSALISMLKKQNMKSLWISTRPNFKTKLEEELNVFSLKLKPFEEEDQKEFLKTYWKVNIKNELSEKRLVEFCSRILSQFSHTIGDQPTQFCGIPLQLRMIAEIFTGKCKKCCDSSCRETVEKMMGNIETTMSLIDLYDEFFRIKFEVVQYQEKNRMDLESIYVKQIVKDQAPGVLQTHRILAVFTILHEEMREKFLSPDEILQGNQLLETVSDSREKTGIVYRIVNGQPVFVHQTFAEYFFIDCFWQKLMTVEFESEALVDDLICNGRVQVCRFLLQKVHKERTVHENPLKPESLIRFCKAVVQMRISHHECPALLEKYELHSQSSDMMILLKVVDSSIVLLKEKNCGSSAIVSYLLPEDREILFCASISNNLINLVKCLKDAFSPWNINDTYIWDTLNNEQYKKNDFMDDFDDFDRLTALHVAAEKGYIELVEHLIEVGADVNVISNDRSTPLQMALDYRQMEIVELLVKNGANVDIPDWNGETALMLSLQTNLYDTAENLIVHSDNIESTDSRGLTAFHYAAREGHAGIFAKLVAASANVDATTENGETALMIASSFGHSDAVDALLERTNNINTANSRGWTALHYAAKQGKVETIKKLLTTGANVDAITKNGKTALLVAFEFGHSDAVDALIERDKNINAADSEGWTALHYVAKQGKVETIKKLLTTEANVDAITKNGKTALLVASEFGHSDAVDALIERDKNINAADSEGWTALHYVAKQGKVETIKKLLTTEANVDAITKNGKTALLVAFEFGHSDAVDALIERDKNINAADSEGWTALHYVAKQGKVETIKKLLTTEANVDAITKNGKTALLVAFEFGHSDAVDALIERDKNINAADSEGWTALHYVAIQGKVETIKKLLTTGANVDATTKNGDTPLIVAVKSRCSDALLIDALLERDKNINATNSEGWTALHYAAEQGKVETIKKLLTTGANVDATTKNGDTPLIVAVKSRCSDALLIDALLEQTNNIDAANSEGWTALHYAADQGKVETIKKLLTTGANVDATTKNGDTPLIVAAKALYSDALLIDALLERDKNINATNSEGWTALHYAADQGKFETIKKLLTTGANVDATTKNGDTPLIVAVKSWCRNALLIDALLEQTNNIDAANSEGWTALHYAAKEGKIETIKTLLTAGANVDATTEDGDTALMIASEFGRINVVHTLLERDENINATNSKGWTALHYAAEQGRVRTIQKLLTTGANVDATANNGDTPLIVAAKSWCSASLPIDALLERTNNVNAANSEGWTALHYTAKAGNVKTIKKLLTTRANVDAVTENGDTALMVATKFGRSNVIHTLLARDKNINAANSEGWTALHYAAKAGNVKTVRKLLTAGANVDATTENGDTALMIASEFGRSNVVHTLLERDENINATNSKGWTALHYAAEQGKVKTIQKLLTTGANVDATTNNGDTPLIVAAKSWCSASLLIDALLERTNNINAANSEGWTALHYAAKAGNVKTIKKLLTTRANVDAVTENGDTALMVASKFGRSNVIHTLLARDKNINAANSEGWTALHYAAKAGNVKTENCNNQNTVDNEANVDATTNNGGTLSIFATKAWYSNALLIDALLERTNNINAANSEGWTALHYAAKAGNVKTIKKLLTRGANVDAATENGVTALMVASEFLQPDVVQTLLERDNNINDANSRGCTAFHYAAKAGYVEIIEPLLTAAANVNATTESGATAYEIASRSNHSEVARLLLTRASLFNTADSNN
ncbi:uncharacterized protein LOC129729275 [Wyeomyia smithii]|uniref:uncharacterized protein LOC129729275 n=1 Tax=Wyeomyia smithii TaxID=174621 RepID=UPI002467E73B|nr:uncharacterized protein LOC129729275 [Wyeomyia smithii]